MDNLDYKIWIARAESNLKLAVSGKDDDVFFEDLCFELQQASEKAIKALIIYFGADFPKTHSLGLLLKVLNEFVEIPEEIEKIVELTDYAVQTRYPGDYCPVGEDEYDEAIRIAKNAIEWTKNIIKDNK